MSNEIEQRLASAAQAVREHDLCAQQHRRLSAREQNVAAQEAAARMDYAGAEKDVERLEHLSLARLLADPRGGRLLALAEERGRLTAEVDELRRATDDADAALQALAEVQGRLGTAADWSAFDTYLDHGIIANAIKHDRIDQAAEAAREADQRLAALRSDLAELGGLEPTAPRLEISSGFKFADIFFNNLFTDLAVGRQIREAQLNVDRSVQQVEALRGPAHGSDRLGHRPSGGHGRGAGTAACAVVAGPVLSPTDVWLTGPGRALVWFNAAPARGGRDQGDICPFCGMRTVTWPARVGPGRPARNMSIAQSTMLFAGRLRNRHAPAGDSRGVKCRKSGITDARRDTPQAHLEPERCLWDPKRTR